MPVRALARLAGGVRRLAVVTVVVVVVAQAPPGWAQVIGGPRPAPLPPPEFGFLTRYAARVGAARITGDGTSQFKWDADLNVDMDVFDFGVVRGNVFINVETVVGGERRAIDPNQNAYTFDLSVFHRAPVGELGVTFHHISRHLSDREHPGSPAWNMVGVSYGDRQTLGGFHVEVIGRWLGMIESSEVDYRHEFNGFLRVLRPVSERVSVFGEVDGSAVLVEEDRFGRPTQYGGRVDLGVRVRGVAGAVELRAGRERRIDAGVLSRAPVRWGRLTFLFVVE